MCESDKKDWRDIAEAASNEPDPAKLLDLAKQLEKALDDDQQLKHTRKPAQLVREEGSGEKAG